MKLAAVDIGSNAIRLQLTNIIEYQGLVTFKKLEYIRFPMRLGHDVFSTGRISQAKEKSFFKLMQSFKNIIDLYEVDHYYGCATSAMREASNGQVIVEKTRQDLGLEIEIISGKREAELINEVIKLYLDHKAYLHIDVGGGSTELNLYYNKEIVLSESFEIGSVRSLEFGDYTQIWRELLSWIQKNIKKNYGKITCVGTGGNINKIFELAEGDKKRKISIDTVMKVQDFLKNMTYEDRMNRLQLNPDRADVIIPASDIYIEVMKAAKAKTILVPDVGLKDGINYFLFNKHYPTKGKVLVRN
jgi:exopolyphosphatase/guanosine-5'-triphosphate,3'-diphosphate pyrophosphatase